MDMKSQSHRDVMEIMQHTANIIPGGRLIYGAETFRKAAALKPGCDVSRRGWGMSILHSWKQHIFIFSGMGSYYDDLP